MWRITNFGTFTFVNQYYLVSKLCTSKFFLLLLRLFVHFVESRYRCDPRAIDRQRLRTLSIAAAQIFCKLLLIYRLKFVLLTDVFCLQPWLLTISCVAAETVQMGIYINCYWHRAATLNLSIDQQLTAGHAVPLIYSC
ncbi:uncharacterized protein Dyak_GE29147 [Drosophila yakuba]|uniref:Uncharacterized protein n=1 Tax=Drosophila yakuba TaxID=7245 RepID=A0A0R1DXF1_DROYA|nr:uncharacterized protein Dyak_GE29147 [Drosophila yakuba]